MLLVRILSSLLKHNNNSTFVSPLTHRLGNVVAGVEQEGIFRLSGSHDKIQALRKAFDRGDNVDLTDPDIDYNCVSGLLKQYLR